MSFNRVFILTESKMVIVVEIAIDSCMMYISNIIQYVSTACTFALKQIYFPYSRKKIAG